ARLPPTPQPIPSISRSLSAARCVRVRGRCIASRAKPHKASMMLSKAVPPPLFGNHAARVLMPRGQALQVKSGRIEQSVRSEQRREVTVMNATWSRKRLLTTVGALGMTTIPVIGLAADTDTYTLRLNNVGNATSSYGLAGFRL